MVQYQCCSERWILEYDRNKPVYYQIIGIFRIIYFVECDMILSCTDEEECSDCEQVLHELENIDEQVDQFG